MNTLKILGSMALLLVSASAMASFDNAVATVPEPATLGLLALGLAGLAAARRKR